MSKAERGNIRASGFGLTKSLGCTHLDEVPCLEILACDRAVRHAAIHLRSNTLVIKTSNTHTDRTRYVEKSVTNWCNQLPTAEGLFVSFNSLGGPPNVCPTTVSSCTSINHTDEE